MSKTKKKKDPRGYAKRLRKLSRELMFREFTSADADFLLLVAERWEDTNWALDDALRKNVRLAGRNLEMATGFKVVTEPDCV